MLFSILTVFISQLLITQGAYDIILEDVSTPAYSKEYMTEPEAYIDSNNEIIANFSIIKKVPMETQAHFFIMGASMGEYVVYTGLDVTMDLCDGFGEPILMGPIFVALGFNADICPPDVGIYQNQGYTLRTDTLPDDFRPNNYKATLEILYEEEKILVVETLIKIV